ncbi:MAG: hypothetical protein ACOC8A_02120 [bacterium]
MALRRTSDDFVPRSLVKALAAVGALALLAGPAWARAEGDRTTFGAKPGKRPGTRPAWLETERPTKAAKQRLKRFASMVQRSLKVRDGDLVLDLQPKQLDRLDIPRNALDLATRYVEGMNALKDEGHVRFEKKRAGVRAAPTRKLETALKGVKEATLQGAGENDMTCQEAWCGYKITVWLDHANTNELLDTLDDAEDAMTLVTALCALVPGLQECAPAMAVATALLAVGGNAIDNADEGNGVKITVHTTPWYASLWADVDPQGTDDGWWPPW